jgi:hypothetical protein
VQFLKYHRFSLALLALVALGLGLAACSGDESAAATPVAEVATPAPAATWTPLPAVILMPTNTAAPTDPASVTPTSAPSATPLPASPTPAASPTVAASPTLAATAIAVPPTAAPTTSAPAATRVPPTAAPPTLSPNPTLGQNLLPNGSFEEGFSNQNGIAELHAPNGWRIEYQEGPTGFGSNAWDVYVRPDTRVFPAAFLPPEEHSLYIFDGSTTLKVFREQGALSMRLVTDVALQPGTYVLEANFFADVFEKYENDQKVAPSDPNAGEAALIAGTGGTGWIANNYLTRNTLKHTFTVSSAQTMTVGVGFRGRYAIANNGWFVDNLSLRQLQ